MNRSLIIGTLIAAMSVSNPLSTQALELKAGEWICGHGHIHRFATTSGPSPNGRNYAPSRRADIKHVAIDITPDFGRRAISGTTTITFTPIAQPLRTLHLDAEELHVANVTSTESIQAWQSEPSRIEITFSQPIAAGKEASVTVRYSATPKSGLYFRTEEMGYEDTHLWTQGEPIESRHWFPSFDFPNEKFTSEVTCRVPEGMSVISNGRRVSSEVDAATGLTAVRWLQDKPHVNYLIALAAGKLKSIEGRYRDIPMAFHAPASQIQQATNSFAGTEDMMGFFEEEIGVPYPWDKYDQVAVSDYHWGGMENTSMTILNERTLYPDGFETLRSSESLVAHELAHQWFGDLVTCKDWSHLWLNEGFATYYDALWHEKKYGRDMFLYVMHQNAEGVINAQNDLTPIVHRSFKSAEEQFSFRAYPKGSWILHMLRHQLGKDLFRQIVKTYLERHRFGVVETEDLVRIIEELSGRSFDAFFDQYVYHAQQPHLKISYQWIETEQLAKVTIEQAQKLSSEVLLFSTPAKIRFKGSFGVVDREIVVQHKSEDFHFPLPSAPKGVRFDPDFGILAKVEFPLPTPLLEAQIEDDSDVIGRLIATKQLASRKDSRAVDLLKRRLQTDSFYGIRLEASGALRQVDTPEAREALLASLSQADARVRQRVLSDATGNYSDISLGTLLKTLATEKNPDIVAAAVRRLGRYSRPEHREMLLNHLRGESYRGVLAEAAMTAIQGLEDPSFLPAVIETLNQKGSKWPASTQIDALELIAHLGRTLDDKEAARAELMRRLTDPRDRVQLAAIHGLGVLGDPKAMAPLEGFIDLKPGDRARIAATSSIDKLRNGRKPTVEFGDIRNEVLSLRRENQDLKRDLESLRKKVESLNAAPPAPKSTPPPRPLPRPPQRP